MIPAQQGSLVPLFDQVLADIGDEQSLQQSLSTFSSHMTRMVTILAAANNNSLVLLDEMGAGTDPTEGAALGRAILDQLDTIGCRAIVTTHLGDLKTYAFGNDRAENGAVEFDIETLRPTYRLHIGQFGMSNAIQIAKRLKLPREVISKANHYLHSRKGKLPDLANLQKVKEDAEKARTEALAQQHEAERQKVEYEAKLASLKRESEEAAKLKNFRERLQAGDQVHVTRFDKTARIVRVDHKRGFVAVSVGIGQWEVPLEELLPARS